MATQREELKKEVVHFEERIGKCEEQTIWKIKDVEKLLETRCSEQRV